MKSRPYPQVYCLSINAMMAVIVSCLCLIQPATSWAGNVLDKTGNPTATPIVAFSVRLLSSAYTGNCMQVRRSSDNTTQNIGFTTAGDLDTATLKTFVGTGTGYVSIWYDQSGNGLNAVQPTNADQPTIMVGGVINRDNGRPSVYTNGIAGFLYYQPVTQLNSTTTVTRMEVCRNRSSNFAIIEGLGYYQLDLQLFPTYVMVQYETNNITISGSTMPSTQVLMSINSIRTTGASKLYINTSLQGTNATSITNLNAPDTGFIGIRWDNSVANPGAFSETMLFSSVLSNADRQSINYNENWYYSLGFDTCNYTQTILSTNGTTSRALYACAPNGGPWAYYYDPANPLNLLFGLAKDPGSTGANPSFSVDSINLTVTTNPSSVIYDATSGTNGIFALGRYWNVYTHTALTSPVDIRFFYNPADTVAARDTALAYKSSSGATYISSLQWFKTVGIPFNQDSLTATPTPGIKGTIIPLTPIYGTTSSGTSYAEFDGITSFSGGTGVYTVSNTLVTLPVTLGPFTGIRVDETTQLSWTTVTESNSDRFEIERSTDGTSWITVGQVAAAGNSSITLSYHYTDPVFLPAGNGLYYRLRLVDRDGAGVYSGVILVKSSDNTMNAPLFGSIAPNPFEEEITVTCNMVNSGPVELRLLDMTGSTLLSWIFTASKGENVWTLTNLNGMAKGVYLLQLVQAGTTGISKVVKR